jgi:hypothetical protein
MNRKEKSFINRNRSLLVEEFLPTSWGEERILQIARLVGETKLDYLKSILDRFGLQVIESAWGVLNDLIKEKEPIQSKPRLLNYLIQQRLKGGGKNEQRKG